MAFPEARTGSASITTNNRQTLMDIDQQEVAALERQVGDQALSPLFAKLAYLYLESGRAKDALRICDAGLANFPFYSTGHLVKGKALLHLGMNGEARRELEFVQGWLPTNPTVNTLLASVPQSDDLLLETPPTDQAAVNEEPFGVAEASTESTEATVSEEAGNVFGLPSEAPVTEGMEEIPGADTTPEQSFGGMDAFAQTGTAPSVEDDFNVYAQRKRSELGELNVITLEAYLASPQARAEEVEASSVDDEAFGGGDPLAAAGFGVAAEPGGDAPAMTEEVPSAAPTVVDEDPFAAAGFGVAEETAGDTPVVTGEAPTMEPAAAEEDPFAAAGFGTQEETTPDVSATEHTETPPPFAGFGEVETPPETPVSTQDSSGMDAFGFGGETTEAAEPGGMDMFGGGDSTPQTEETSSADGAPATETEASDIFAGFVGPGEGTLSDEVSEPEAPADETPEEPSFPDFSGMPGAEDSLTEEAEPAMSEELSGEIDGFSGPPAEEPPAPAPRADKIGEFAEKLQDVKKITPVIDLTAQFASTASTADEVAADAGFVTPTLAEIYAKQGWYDDAINAYKNLAKSRPAEKEKFDARVKELEEEKAKAG